MSWSAADAPARISDERELLLAWLHTKRCHVAAATKGLTEDEARWTPERRLIPLIGIVNHLTHVEWRWIDGSYLRAEVSRSEEEFAVASDRPLADVLTVYLDRAQRTDAIVRAAPGLDVPCLAGAGQPDVDLRWVLIHLIEETAHHAGHADATREMLDGTKSGW